MSELTEATISCPYCGESSEVLLDPQEVQQEYIEDCQVCCQPITFMVTVDNDGDLSVAVYSENEIF
ncbi:CPXCG motif-containing cysteine-rich protein [Halomonas halocynthiae]|uniref:CPXCG motif-containing cysteine-rich protein n=1 Tax=Halomonas halocynthiae TaxID=176290 RepID=UPI0004826CA5|nr:CPXCG motif-containing cysteine-rich protein [Halomonas halocynthiae]